jgi:hypothetical protein
VREESTISDNPRPQFRFLQALALSVQMDRMLEARVQKCARKDCGILFSVTDERPRKYLPEGLNSRSQEITSSTSWGPEVDTLQGYLESPLLLGA